jgi:hypothetical protein
VEEFTTAEGVAGDLITCVFTEPGSLGITFEGTNGQDIHVENRAAQAGGSRVVFFDTLGGLARAL